MSTLACESFVNDVVSSGLATLEDVQKVLGEDFDGEPAEASQKLMDAGVLTEFQSGILLTGKTKGLTLGQYKILQPIGKGGMGIVYLAEHKKLHRKAAIKVLPKNKTTEKISLERFYREARAAAALDHPNIVKAYDVDEHNGMHYFVMDYVEGMNLQSYMDEKGAFPWNTVVNYAAQACWGLQHAHTKGMVHRDIKPGNMIVDTTGVLKILDLGLARCFTNEKDNLTENLGADSEVTGSINFIAPEQALGMTVDIRGDIYSLGATLYAMIAGRAPFEGTPAQKLLQHQTSTATDLTRLKPEVPQGVSAVITKMMAKKPEHRFAAPIDVIHALTPWLPPSLAVPGAAPADLVSQAPIKTVTNRPVGERTTRRLLVEETQAASRRPEPPKKVEEPAPAVVEKAAPPKKKKKPKLKTKQFDVTPYLAIGATLALVAVVVWGIYALVNSFGSKDTAKKTTTSGPVGPAPALGPRNPPPNNNPGQNQNRPANTLAFKVGEAAPMMDGFDLEDKRIFLNSHRGKVVLLEFWSMSNQNSWSVLGQARVLLEQMVDKPFVVVGVNMDKQEDMSKIPAFLKHNAITFKHYKDEYAKGQKYSKDWDVKQSPALVLLDTKGRIARIWTSSPSNWGDVKSAADDLISAAAAAAKE